jgi:hypothetical protein
VIADDHPVDLSVVEADDALVERLRGSLSPRAAVVWGDDDDELGDDPSYALLRALQNDVNAELQQAPSAAAAVVPLAPRRRALGRTATVAALTVGALSLAGAAAAATSSPGDAMYGVRSAVAAAVHEVVIAVTPAQPLGPSQPAAPAAPVVRESPRGTSVSAAAASAAAARQVVERLETAARLLAAGRREAAGQVLDQAERRLPLVTDPGLRAKLDAQLAELRAKVADLPAEDRGKPAGTPVAPHGSGKEHPGDGKKATPQPHPRDARSSGPSDSGSAPAGRRNESVRGDDRADGPLLPAVVPDRSGPGERGR